MLRVGPETGTEVVAYRHLGHDGEIPGLLRPSDGLHQLVGEAEGLQNEEVHPSREKAFGLLPEEGSDLLPGGGTEGFDPHAQRAHGPGHQRPVSGHLPGQERCRPVDLPDPILKTEGSELGPAGTVGVRLEDLGPGLQEELVDLRHQLGAGEVELVEAPGDRDAPVVELCTEPAVEEMGSVRPR